MSQVNQFQWRLKESPFLNYSFLNSSSNSTTDAEDATLRAAILIWHIISPILIITGTAGNTISAIVFSRKSLRQMATSLYLIALALADTSILVCGLLFQWLHVCFGITVTTQSDAGCKIVNFLVYGAIQMDAWIIVSVTLERLIALTVLLKSQLWFTRRRACYGLIALLILILGLNCHFFFTVNLMDYNGAVGCYCSQDYNQFCAIVLPWIDIFVAAVVPFVLMFVMNIVIVIKLHQYDKSKKKYGNHDNAGQMTAKKNQRGSQEQPPSVTALTAMLLCVSFIFILASLPLLLFEALYFEIQGWANGDDSLFFLINTVCYMLSYSNSAVNFPLYCLTSPKFRNELGKNFRWCRRKMRRCRKNKVGPF